MIVISLNMSKLIQLKPIISILLTNFFLSNSLIFLIFVFTVCKIIHKNIQRNFLNYNV